MRRIIRDHPDLFSRPKFSHKTPLHQPSRHPLERDSQRHFVECGELRLTMENELIITGAFLGAGLLAFVIIPGLLVVWDRVLDHMEW
jgi:hypothetical protein